MGNFPGTMGGGDRNILVANNTAGEGVLVGIRCTKETSAVLIRDNKATFKNTADVGRKAADIPCSGTGFDESKAAATRAGQQR